MVYVDDVPVESAPSIFVPIEVLLDDLYHCHLTLDGVPSSSVTLAVRLAPAWNCISVGLSAPPPSWSTVQGYTSPSSSSSVTVTATLNQLSCSSIVPPSEACTTTR